MGVRTAPRAGSYTGETLPVWLGEIAGARRELDVSAVIVDLPNSKRSVRLSVVNRSEDYDYTDIPVRLLGLDVDTTADAQLEVEAHEIWHADVRATNTWDKPETVSETTRRGPWVGRWTFRAHSFTLLVIDLAK